MSRRFLAVCLLMSLVFPTLPRSAAAAATTPLQSLLDNRVARFSGGAGLFVSDPTGGNVLYSHDPDQLIVTASLYKLAVLLEAERRVEAGQLRYKDSVTIEPEDITDDGSFEVAGTVLSLDDALERMITISDNGTALELLHSFTPQRVNATLVANGIRAFRIGEDPAEDNEASPRAIATFFTLLAQKRLVSRAASDRMLARLERQQINDRLPANLPAGTRVAHKTGNLRYLTHDAGIIYGKTGEPMIVVGMTWNGGGEEAVNLIRDLGALVYANAVVTPTNAGYGLPQQPVLADAGRPLVQTVKLTNLGLSDWMPTQPDPFKLIWQITDAKGSVVMTNPRPVPLWNVALNASIDVPVVLNVPEISDEYKVTFGLADDRHGPLATLGTATGSFTLRAHPPYLVTLDVGLSPVLHRDEPTAAVLTLGALPELGADRRLDLGWRVLDPRNARVLTQGSAPAGVARRGQTTTLLTSILSPAVRGSYTIDIYVLDNGQPVSPPVRKTVTIAGARTYPGELVAGAGRTPPPLPRIRPRPSAGQTPAGKTPPPQS